MLSALPLPALSADESAHAARVAAHIRAEIAAAGGWIPFAQFMQLALYAPGLGYYSAGTRKFGASGDFVTAPELTPVFARCLAGQVAEVLAPLAEPEQARLIAAMRCIESLLGAPAAAPSGRYPGAPAAPGLSGTPTRPASATSTASLSSPMVEASTLARPSKPASITALRRSTSIGRCPRRC